MKIKKAFQLAFNILLHSKLRSWLTIIGIVIGIAAIVSIISVTEGAQANLQNQLNSFGANILTVTPGFSRASGASGGFRTVFENGPSSSTTNQKNLTTNDVNIIKNIQNVDYVMGTISSRESAAYLSNNASVSIEGVDPLVWKNFVSSQLSSGRYLGSGDVNSVVVGGNVANSVFSGMTVNSQIDIGGQLFRVVGILKQSGNQEDSQVFMPIQTLRNLEANPSGNYFNSISVEIKDTSLSNQTVNDITQNLMVSRGIFQAKNQDFTVTSPQAFQARISSALGSTSIFLAAIAAISLIVGAVGISNTMFTSVMEKTREIGIMKAIGAKNNDILLIFLINSGLIGLVGGIGGVILGIIGAGFIGSLTSGSQIGGRLSLGSVYINPVLIIGAFLISIIVGMIAGVIPAYRASKLKPIEALRYE
ncbi:MAG: ABC transporter permease [Candidatus Pacearchaeota archaeon]|jgi:putative ABC transport system permease protein